MSNEKNATPPKELERQIMSSLVPKNEREHWACGEIESLRQKLADSKKQNASLKEALIGWRQRAWPGTDQRAVVERDYPEIVGDK